MDPISIAMLAGSGIKAIGGLIQGIGGRKKQRSLWANRPQLGVTEGETANDALYSQMASATEMPGQRQFESKLGETYATGVYDTQKTAISSAGATQSAIDLSSRKTQAIQDLAGQFAEFKAKRQDALAGWNREKVGLEQQRFQVNEFDPWNVKMNEAVGQKQAGFASMGSGLDTGLGVLGDLQGTAMYLKLLEKLYPNLGGDSGSNAGSLIDKGR